MIVILEPVIWFMLLRLGKDEAQEMVLLMLCETQGARLAAVINYSKLFETEKDNFILEI